MGTFYSTSESKGQNIGSQQTSKKNGPLFLACSYIQGGQERRRLNRQ